ncbi:hypothetical protein WJX84_000013 [Apatococcus fuscideae]|uniref:Folylpolyglutamate synthase n=1 Tax=Apatococcus fuscideae TaxID=2026836 RepID=A0AAW1TDG4_9CHLO
MAENNPEQTYAATLEKLSSLITQERRGAGQWETVHEYMGSWIQRLELDRPLQELSVVHVAGTKGKGSTCAMVESILRSCGYTTGLFTSPHLVDVRERIRLNGVPISKEKFVTYFSHCHNRLQATSDGQIGMAAYFRFLTLLGLQVFTQEQLDVTILEVGLGGRLDATNCIPSPPVCGVTSLGLDHTEILGDTIELIAAEKAGIFKAGSRAFTVPQQPSATQVLKDKAECAGIELTVARSLDEIHQSDGEPIHFGLAGAYQRVNAALAVELATAWEERVVINSSRPQSQAAAARVAMLRSGRLPEAYQEGLRQCVWPGRAQVIQDPGSTETGSGLTFYLDGAHTEESMASCGEWFHDAVQESAASKPGQASQRVLLFNCLQERDPTKLLRSLSSTMRQRQSPFHHAIFTPPDSQYGKLKPAGVPGARDVSWQQTLCQAWSVQAPQQAQGACEMLPLPVPVDGGLQDTRLGAVAPGLGSSIEWLRSCARLKPQLHMEVLVTGSLYLVGDVLKLLGKAPG